jgi:hypothetical protein
MNALRSIGAVAGAVAAISTGASAAQARTPTFPTWDGSPAKDNPVVRPSEIVYSGDGSHRFAGPGRKLPGALHWTLWNATNGRAGGDDWINNCTPACADGTWSRYPVALHVDRPAEVGPFFIFTRLSFTFTGNLPPGSRRTFTWKVGYANGLFEIG